MTEPAEQAQLRQQVTRIQTLEAALRKISEWPPALTIDDAINDFIDVKQLARVTLENQKSR